jgi:hypothetical protein
MKVVLSAMRDDPLNLPVLNGAIQVLAQAGVDTLELASDEDLAAAIVRFVHLRRQRSRLTAGSVAPRPHH